MKSIFLYFLVGSSLLFSGCEPSQSSSPPPAPARMVYVPVGENQDGEKTKAFFVDKTLVTVAQFSAFVEATNFKTQAETFGDAGVFEIETGEWTLRKGADFRHPFGPENPAASPDHPVTQVSWNDAVAYAKWAGKRLPSPEEWYSAASSGLEKEEIYSWGGNNWLENGKFKANFWQGSFPVYNTVADGYLYTSPVGAFGTNKLGMSDMGGNVWQWTTAWQDENITDEKGEKIQVGGSYLCDPVVCHGFKMGNTAHATTETSLCHVGFRCVKDLN